MNMHEECLKRQNEGYHTPLPEVIKRIERDSKKIKPSYEVLDISDAVFYLREYSAMLQKLFWDDENKYWILYGNYQEYLKHSTGDECPKRK